VHKSCTTRLADSIMTVERRLSYHAEVGDFEAWYAL
jgi:hypothetical protein